MVNRRHLIVIGQVIVDYTDKIREQMAVVGELTDRLKGVVHNVKTGAGNDADQLAGIVSTIEKNVGTLVGKSRHLHRFGHRLNDPGSPYNPVDVIEEVVTFLIRAARLHRVTLSCEKPETVPDLTGDPVFLHLLVVLLINGLLEQVGTGGKIAVRAGKTEQGILVEILAEGSFAPEDPHPEEDQQQYRSLVRRLVDELGGSLLDEAAAEGKKRTSLALPL